MSKLYIPKLGFSKRLTKNKEKVISDFCNHAVSLYDLMRLYHINSLTIISFLKIELGEDKYQDIISYNKKFHIQRGSSELSNNISYIPCKTISEFSKDELNEILVKLKGWISQKYTPSYFKYSTKSSYNRYNKFDEESNENY